MPVLLLTIRFHDGRYHGAGDWPPSPARLFQALVAGAACGRTLAAKDIEALEWLESLAPPVIAAPPARAGNGFTNYVPNNDLDAVGGDPARVGEIRTPKIVKPHLFDADIPLIYAWTFHEGAKERELARTICAIAARLYQLGRGVDMAWAVGEILEGEGVEERLEARLAEHARVLYRPCERGEGKLLACPADGSLKSLIERYKESGERFRPLADASGKKAKGQTFSQARRAQFRQVAYDSPPARFLFDIRWIGGEKAKSDFAAQSLTETASLVKTVRDGAAARLEKAFREKNLSGEAAHVPSVFGLRCDASDADKASRIRIVPLPSIGFVHADRAIRRVLVEVPPNCPLRASDIEWAFSGLDISDSKTGEILETLVPADDDRMLDHYGVRDAARLWRTITPAVLPATRRRSRSGTERAANERDAACDAFQALRHAGVTTKARVLRAQREPFEAKGGRAESFAHGERFRKERLWHVEIEFAEPVRGPLVIGDGRYLGLGLMAPVSGVEGVIAFAIEGGACSGADPVLLARALRRAVMARVQAALGPGETLPKYFSGHDDDGGPARSGAHEHLACVYDGKRRRLLIIAPHVIERRAPSRDEATKRLPLLEKAMTGFCELLAGALGKLRLARIAFEPAADPLFAPAREWESETVYRVLRHRKLANADAALAADIEDECRRLGLPPPAAETMRLNGVPGAGLTGRARLRFACAIEGPLLIGRDRHFGGGLFSGNSAPAI